MMHFVKMHGLGNDYVYMDGFTTALPADDEELKKLAVAVSDRHRGIGSDGLILILPSSVADIRMRMFNSDGSESEMCGNGIRCVGRYALTRGLISRHDPTVETGAGLRHLEISKDAGMVTVDMGEPEWVPARIPLNTRLAEGEDFIRRPLRVDGRNWEVTCLSVGNPHAVLFLPDIASLDLEHLGPLFEHHPMFPRRINTEFIHVRSAHDLDMRVWERGAGETRACGTGACAAAVAAMRCNLVSRKVRVHLPGGPLDIEWRDNNHIFMTGEAVTVFEGDWPDQNSGAA